jgi:hypothetical protein
LSIFPPITFSHWSRGSADAFRGNSPNIDFELTHSDKLTANFKELIPTDIANTLLAAALGIGIPAFGA